MHESQTHNSNVILFKFIIDLIILPVLRFVMGKITATGKKSERNNLRGQIHSCHNFENAMQR